MSRPRNRGAARSGGAHAMNAASRGRLLRDEVVRLLHETGLTASALARLQWCTAMDPERLRVFAAKAGARNLPESQWTAIVTILDELWHADAEVGHGTPDSYVVRFYGGSDLVTRANAILRILQSAPAQPVIQRVSGRHAKSRDSDGDGVALPSTRGDSDVR